MTTTLRENSAEETIPLRLSRWKLLRELTALHEVALLGVNVPRLAFQPRGEGRCVLVAPGYGAGDASTAALRSYLRILGYNVFGWVWG